MFAIGADAQTILSSRDLQGPQDQFGNERSRPHFKAVTGEKL